ncbi:hypothetical protein K504DRAFT_245306 [Pleomassaria siparia CBS 279.74]|uniref:Uncharacterized protein n=1 Tax=Pleomassaria siparia CBS 279.74 TaxID=1314801 RepID=A0A6G1KEM8_9PLEO|nr:hypothetical protein K504DRAFT_245306 [Pleomassaria siparia CBS 279.74]
MKCSNWGFAIDPMPRQLAVRHGSETRLAGNVMFGAWGWMRERAIGRAILFFFDEEGHVHVSNTPRDHPHRHRNSRCLCQKHLPHTPPLRHNHFPHSHLQTEDQSPVSCPFLPLCLCRCRRLRWPLESW